MASTAIHLAIAKIYIEKHNALNYKKFIKGTLFPDAETNSIELHYPKGPNLYKLAIGVYNKVDLYAFLKDHPNFDDFKLGWFLHLVTDYLFFHECFTRTYLMNTNSSEFEKELYHTYDCLDSYLITKYHISKKDYEDYPKQYYPGRIPYEECLLSKDQIDNFIKRVSSIDLEKYIKKIQEKQHNVKP